MASLPQPPTPAALQSILRADEDIVAVRTGTRLIRIFWAGGPYRGRWNSFRHFGPVPHGRFDPHPLGETDRPVSSAGDGVMYLQLSLRTSIAEAFDSESTVDRSTQRPHLVVFRPTRTVRLLDLSGLWAARVGASQEISSGPENVTQAWARAIRAAHPELDGIWYRSSWDAGAPEACLWDPPAASVLPAAPDMLLPLDHPGLDVPLGRICEELNYTLL